MTTYKTITTFPGADKATTFYFSTEEKAIKFLETCENGNVEPETIDSIYRLPFEACTWNDIRYWID